MKTNRREFLKQAAAASALTAGAIPAVHGGVDETIQVALVGAGGRGTGAAEDALSVKSGQTKLVAMADVFDVKLKRSHQTLSGGGVKAKVDVPPDRRFIGFDGYKKAMDCLKKDDIVILTTPLAFRAVMFEYAISKGLNVFMEKPVTADGPTSKKMLGLAEEATKKGLKCGVGLMVRHCRGRMELKKRIEDGEIGDIVAMRAYRMHGPVGSAFSRPKGVEPGTGEMTELMYQIHRFHSFIWASGGLFSDFYIHQIDETSWMKGSWPVKAVASGGRHYRGDAVDQNFDNYSVEYTYGDGSKLFFYGRTMKGARQEMTSYVHGSKGSAVVSSGGHTPGRVRTWKGQKMTDDQLIWAFPQPEPNPYREEWNDLVEAIRENKPYNEVKRGVEASVVTSMGRMAAHTAQEITFDQMLNCPHAMAPDLEKFEGPNSPAPVQADKDGKYPIPQPGELKDREY
jgi:hypothetical protein